MLKKKEYRGFLIRKGSRYMVNSKVTSSILLNQMHIDLLVRYQDCIRGKLLDAGCGEKPYSLLYDRLTGASLGCDIEACVHDQGAIDIYASVDSLPFDDETFDTILCTNVLEHTAEAGKAFQELSRCLKRGGYLILSAPFLYPLHEAPHDYYRYTVYGLSHQIEKSGLKIKKVVPLGGPGLLLAVYFHLFVAKLVCFKPIQICDCFMQKIFYRVYKRVTFQRLCKGYSLGCGGGKLHTILSAGYFVIAIKK